MWWTQPKKPLPAKMPGTPIIQDATAAILCGGKSRRMGFDKAFLRTTDGSLLLAQNAHLLQKLFARVVLVSDVKEKLLGTEEFSNFPVLEDLIPAAGPLGGIYSILKAENTDCAFVMACDMPGPDSALILQMHHALGAHQVVLCTHGGRAEPLFAFYHKSCLPTFHRQLKEQDFRLRSEFSQFSVKTIELSAQQATSCFRNLNSREDVDRWHKTAGKTL